MNYKILYCHLNLFQMTILEKIKQQYHIDLIEIQSGNILLKDILLNNQYTSPITYKEPLLIFVMNMKTMYSIIDELKASDCYIPYKAMITEYNLNFTVNELYAHLIEEHQQLMKENKNG